MSRRVAGDVQCCRTRIILNSQFSILNFKAYFHGHGGVGEVGDFGADFDGVALTQEAGHKGLHHQLLLRLDGAVEGAYLEAVAPGKALQVPLGEGVGQGEGDADATLLVAAQGRLEEGEGAEVLPQGGRGVGGGAVEIEGGTYLGYCLFGHIYARALADTAMHRHHAILATGSAHTCHGGNDTLHAPPWHTGNIVCRHTHAAFGGTDFNYGYSVHAFYLHAFQQCGTSHQCHFQHY